MLLAKRDAQNRVGGVFPDPAQVAKMGSAAKFYVSNGGRFKKGLTKIG